MTEITQVTQLAHVSAIRPPFIPPAHADAWVHEVLEPDQLSTAKNRFGRAKLAGGTVVLLWGLRLYVLLMTFLIGMEVWNAVHGGG
jgi:hypothetical protein